MTNNEAEPRNLDGYKALIRHVLDYYSDEELIRRQLRSRHLVEASFGYWPRPRALRPDPSPEELLNERLDRISRHPEWRIMRNRLDELQQNPVGSEPLARLVDDSMTVLEEVERSILNLRFNLSHVGGRMRTWRMVQIDLNRSSSPRERGEKAVKRLRETDSFQIDIPTLLLPVDPKIIPFPMPSKVTESNLI